MTNLQAIDLLKGLEQSLDGYCELNDEGKTAFGMAITALELFGNAEQLPPAQPDLSSYSDKLWRNAYERGRKEAMEEIIRCKDCKWGDWYTSVDRKRYCYCMETGNGGRTEDDFCSYAERRTDGGRD